MQIYIYLFMFIVNVYQVSMHLLKTLLPRVGPLRYRLYILRSLKHKSVCKEQRGIRLDCKLEESVV